MSLLSMLNRFNEGMAATSEKLRRSAEVMRATSDLKQQAYAERYTIETALKLARTDLEYREHMQRPEFREIHEQIRSAMKDASASQPPTEAFDTPPPDFRQVPTHSDAATSAAIREVVDELKAERADFLADVSRQLASDTELSRCFLIRMDEIGAARYLSALNAAHRQGTNALP